MDNEPFPDELINEIAGAIKCTVAQKRAYLARELRSMVGFARLQRSGQSLGCPSDRNRELETIEKAATRLLKSIGFEDGEADLQALDAKMNGQPTLCLLCYHLAAEIDPDWPEKIIRLGHADEAILDAVKAVVRLRKAAAAARPGLRRRIRLGRGGDRHQEDGALKEVVWHLLRLYREVTGRNPGASVHPATGGVGGPAVRFLLLCLQPLGWTGKTKDAARDLIRAVMSNEDHP